MKVRPRNSAGFTRKADDFSLFDDIRFCRVDFGKMGIDRVDPYPMIDNHDVSGVEKVAGENDLPPVGALDRSSRTGGKIYSKVLPFLLFVEHPPYPIYAGHLCRQGTDERLVEIRSARASLFVDGRNNLSFSLHP